MQKSLGTSVPCVKLETPRGLILSGTGSDESLSTFARSLAQNGLPEAELFEWDSLLRTVLDPDERRWNQPGWLCLFMLGFEDLDHFADHLRDSSIRPSYKLVEKKTRDLAACLQMSAPWRAVQFCVCVMPWSTEAHERDYLRRFFEETACELEETLAGISNVIILRQWANCYRWDEFDSPAPASNVYGQLEFVGRHNAVS